MRIAFIDHHLNNYHANTFLKLLREEGAEVAACWESHPDGDDWAAKNSVSRADSIEDAVNAADATMLLAPDNIERHLDLCRVVLPFGKPTFIDKMLAFETREAEEIVALAAEHKTPIMSGSALRCAVEFEAFEGREQPEEAFGRGMGKLFGYGIHTLSMVQRLMGVGVRRVIDTGTENCRLIALDYGDRRAFVELRTADNLWDSLSWQMGAKYSGEYVTEVVKDFAGFYRNQALSMLDFFETGRSPWPIEESLEAVKIHQAAEQSRREGGAWVGLK
ncbi:MAG: hypothetical protein HUU60_05035 [Armatimonadetes bacterium]|nr:hypothetical protein [Armatimonadota bacterium]